MEPQPSSSSSSLNKQLKPEEATKTLDQEHIIRLTEDAYKNLAEYTKAELQVTVDDCQLLETMNKATKEKYAQMSEMTQRLMREMSNLQNSYADFSSFTNQIQDIHTQCVDMENTARALDDYSKYLEQKLCKIQPTKNNA
ncbi:hypothetical protein K501DRAFT_240996 [Backusella circina FSU 941]|nr:hypothetical protein K501DRAFT_240996 [Backusella circina FSU 941]